LVLNAFGKKEAITFTVTLMAEQRPCPIIQGETLLDLCSVKSSMRSNSRRNNSEKS
jgi:hypothetical protein